MENNNFNVEQNTVPPATPEPVSENRCPVCQALVDSSLAFCPECGNALKKKCAKCGADMEDNQTFCSKCGQPVASPVFAAAPASASSKKGWLIPVIIGGVVTLVIIIAIIFSIANKPDFNEMFSEYKGNEWFTVASDGSYMIVDSNPTNVDADYVKYSTLMDSCDAVESINERLGFSSYVYDDMMQTTYNDGKQYAENDEYRISWTYHPDEGLEVKYEVK